MLPTVTILDAIQHPTLFGPWFRPPSAWNAWRTFLAGLFGLTMSEEQAETFRRHTGRPSLPISPTREAWLVVGRRGGKSRISALVAVFLACFRDYAEILAPGERATVMIIAADRRQARVVFRYVVGLLKGVPALERLVASRTVDRVDLTMPVSIDHGAADVPRWPRSSRGHIHRLGRRLSCERGRVGER
jgi:hypothetical protein